jgi:hypothetical protein
MFEDSFEQLEREIKQPRKPRRQAAYDLLHEFDETRYENNRARRKERWFANPDNDFEARCRDKRREPRYDRTKRI